MLAACGGGGGGGSPMVPVPVGGGGGGGGGAPPPSLPSSITTSSGAIIGQDNAFSPTDGDAAAGGNGQTVDGMPCLTTLNENYHIHVFVGLIQNGHELALPDGIGMKNPGADSGGVTSTASCFYYLHTHDASGIVHVEDPSTASRTTALHTLGQFFAIWGQPLGAWTTIYTSGQSYRGQGSQFVSNSTYTKYGGSPGSMPLYAHEVIWLESGSPTLGATALPGVQFTY